MCSHVKLLQYGMLTRHASHGSLQKIVTLAATVCRDSRGADSKRGYSAVSLFQFHGQAIDLEHRDDLPRIDVKQRRRSGMRSPALPTDIEILGSMHLPFFPVQTFSEALSLQISITTLASISFDSSQ